MTDLIYSESQLFCKNDFEGHRNRIKVHTFSEDKSYADGKNNDRKEIDKMREEVNIAIESKNKDNLMKVNLNL